MSTYKLRPHHGLCLHFFRGAGYSPAFVENMTEIARAMEENPTIELVAGSDNVCRPCPNRIGKVGCASDEKVLRYDGAVLQLCHLSVGQKLTWREFFRGVADNILSPGLLNQVCDGCQWIEICRGIQEKDTIK